MIVNRIETPYNRSMTDAEQEKRDRAVSAGADDIELLLHDPSPHVLSALLDNRNLTEDHVLIIAARKNLPPEIFSRIAKDHRWSESYPIRLALAANPKTPLSISLSIARYLRLFDLAKLARSPHIPVAFKIKIEALIMERIPTMPSGLQKTLAKMAAGNVLLKLLQTSDADVISLCLNNPRLLESHLYKIISRKDTAAETIRLIAAHANWSLRPSVRFALIRNEQTPLPFSERFLQTMTIPELRDLYTDPSLPAAAKPLVYRELLSRGKDTAAHAEDAVYEIDEQDEIDLDNFTRQAEEE
jgi:hypothetical protein